MYVFYDNNFPNPKLAHNSLSDVKIVKIKLYLGVDRIYI